MTPLPDYPMSSKTQPEFIGGLVMGVLSALPLISAGNLCCCLWIICGGVVAAYMLQQNSETPITQSDGALVGMACSPPASSAPVSISPRVDPRHVSSSRRCSSPGALAADEPRQQHAAGSSARYNGRPPSAASSVSSVGFTFMLVMGVVFFDDWRPAWRHLLPASLSRRTRPGTAHPSVAAAVARVLRTPRYSAHLSYRRSQVQRETLRRGLGVCAMARRLGAGGWRLVVGPRRHTDRAGAGASSPGGAAAGGPDADAAADAARRPRGRRGSRQPRVHAHVRAAGAGQGSAAAARAGHEPERDSRSGDRGLLHRRAEERHRPAGADADSSAARPRLRPSYGERRPRVQATAGNADLRHQLHRDPCGTADASISTPGVRPRRAVRTCRAAARRPTSSPIIAKGVQALLSDHAVVQR